MANQEIEEIVCRVLDRIKDDQLLTPEEIYTMGKELRKELEGVATLKQMLGFATLFFHSFSQEPAFTMEQKEFGVQAFSDGFRVGIRRVESEDGSEVTYTATDLKVD